MQLYALEILGATILIIVAIAVYKRSRLNKSKSDQIDKCIALMLQYFHHVNLSNWKSMNHAIDDFIEEHDFIGEDYDVTLEDKIIISTALFLLGTNSEINIGDAIKDIHVTSQERSTSPWVYKNNSVVKNQGGFDLQININDVKYGFSNISDNRNIIIHLFAHIIDGMDGDMDGLPSLILTPELKAKWDKIIEEHQERLLDEDDSYLNRFSLAKKSNFFATMTELYFESGHEMKSKYPDLYEVLKETFKHH